MLTASGGNTANWPAIEWSTDAANNQTHVLGFWCIGTDCDDNMILIDCVGTEFCNNQPQYDGYDCYVNNELCEDFNGDGQILDWIGDGYCDERMVDFNCLALAYDMGDCEIDFTNHVMPLIIANCTGYCHSGASNYQGGLNLETYAGLMDGGNSGPAVIPYYPDYSLIIQKLNGDAPGSQMPDQASPLPDNYINTIYYWIEQGAIGSDDNDDGGAGEGILQNLKRSFPIGKITGGRVMPPFKFGPLNI